MMSEDDVLGLIAGLDRARLRRWVRQGWVRPDMRGTETGYRDVDVARVRLIVEIREELAVEPENVPLVLSLIDQVHGLRRELRKLAEAVDAQPAAVRRQIILRLEGGT